MNFMNNSNYLKGLLLTLFLITFYGINTQAGEQDNKLSSPYETVLYFLNNLQEDSWEPGLAAKTLNIKDNSSKEAQKLIVKLKKILDGKALYIDVDELPKNVDYKDSITHKRKFILFDEMPQIYLVKKDDKWLFSKETAAAVPALFEQVYPFQVDKLLAELPDFFRSKIIGVEVWQYIGLFIYLIIAFVLYRIFSWIFGFVIIKIISKFKFKEIAAKYIKKISRPLSFLLIVLLLMAFLPILQLPLGFAVVLTYILKVLSPVAITLIAFRLTDSLRIYLTAWQARPRLP